MLLYIPVYVPGEDTAVKSRRDKEPRRGIVLNVLDPVGVRLEGAHFVLHEAHIPQAHCGVVRAGGEHPRVQEPEMKKHHQ